MTKYEFKTRLSAEIEIANANLSHSKLNRKYYSGQTYRIAGDDVLSIENYVNIVGLCKFVVRENAEDGEVELWLRCCDKEFPFLNELINIVPDGVEELRDHGPMSVAMMYRQRKVYEAKIDKALEVPLK